METWPEWMERREVRACESVRSRRRSQYAERQWRTLCAKSRYTGGREIQRNVCKKGRAERMIRDTLKRNTAVPMLARLPIYYGWVNLVVASLAMTATLPGRTHGLGMITKPLTEDATLGVGEQSFSHLNFWAILLGSLMCLPVGRAIDRYGVRGVLTAVVAALGAAVLLMSRAQDWGWLFIALILVRGLGQGALSVCSLAVVGKWFSKRVGPAMGVFSVLLTIGFIFSVLALGGGVAESGWRVA